MALKERIPSPTDIANQVKQVEEIEIPKPFGSKNPTGEPTKFSPKEITTIQELQNQHNQLIMNFGQLKLSEIKLKQSENLLLTQLSGLEKEESTLAGTLNKKYGRGSINVETGEFTPTDIPTK
tara:strand:- start:526 stop:894 length:369 start_codon:yes stop_codon:yes gene_type:complete